MPCVHYQSVQIPTDSTFKHSFPRASVPTWTPLDQSAASNRTDEALCWNVRTFLSGKTKQGRLKVALQWVSQAVFLWLTNVFSVCVWCLVWEWPVLFGLHELWVMCGCVCCLCCGCVGRFVADDYEEKPAGATHWAARGGKLTVQGLEWNFGGWKVFGPQCRSRDMNKGQRDNRFH